MNRFKVTHPWKATGNTVPMVVRGVCSNHSELRSFRVSEKCSFLLIVEHLLFHSLTIITIINGEI